MEKVMDGKAPELFSKAANMRGIAGCQMLHSLVCAMVFCDRLQKRGAVIQQLQVSFIIQTRQPIQFA
jgi:hypothetical protein